MSQMTPIVPRPLVMLLTVAVLCFLGYAIYNESDWKIVASLGAFLLFVCGADFGAILRAYSGTAQDPAPEPPQSTPPTQDGAHS